ncbi:MAG: hypothetical protein ACR2J8_12085 [Thermomicrobiales bacterium]
MNATTSTTSTFIAASTTRRRFALGILPAFAAAGFAIGLGAAAPDAASANGRKRKPNRRPDRTRPNRPGNGTTTNPPAPQRTLDAFYDLADNGSLTIVGGNFQPDQDVLLKIRMDWSPDLGAYMVDRDVTAHTDATGAFTWIDHGFCPHKVDVWAAQPGAGDLHLQFEDTRCPW